jgi:hypothetical protein
VSCRDSEIVENGTICCILSLRLRFLHMRTRHRLIVAFIYIIHFVLFLHPSSPFFSFVFATPPHTLCIMFNFLFVECGSEMSVRAFQVQVAASCFSFMYKIQRRLARPLYIVFEFVRRVGCLWGCFVLSRVRCLPSWKRSFKVHRLLRLPWEIFCYSSVSVDLTKR